MSDDNSNPFRLKGISDVRFLFDSYGGECVYSSPSGLESWRFQTWTDAAEAHTVLATLCRTWNYSWSGLEQITYRSSKFEIDLLWNAG
jgi:hypothetical protein